MKQRIAIIGNGNIGCYLASLLALDGNDVALIGRHGSQSMKEIARFGGLQFTSSEINEIKGLNQAPWNANHITIPERGLSREDFLRRFEYLGNFKQIVANSMDSMGMESIEQTYPKEKLLSVIDRAFFAPIGKNLHLVTDTRDCKSFDKIILAVKSYDINTSLACRVKDIIADGGKVAIVSNGLMPWVTPGNLDSTKNIDALADIHQFIDIVGKEKILGAIAMFGAEFEDGKEGLKQNGKIKLVTPIPLARVALGDLAKKDHSEGVEDFVNFLKSSGVNAFSHEKSIGIPLIHKLAVNINNIITSIFGITVGRILEDPLLKEVTLRARGEIFDSAITAGVPYSPEHKQEFVNGLISYASQVHLKNYKPSTYKDIEAGSLTERSVLVDAIRDLSPQIDTPILNRLSVLMEQVEAQAIADKKYGINGLKELRKSIYTRMGCSPKDATIDHFLSVKFDKLEYTPELTRVNSFSLANQKKELMAGQSFTRCR